jgi:hypothetical protein
MRPDQTSDPAREVTAMIHSADPDARSSAAVRDGHSAPVTCATCGCRLQEAGDAYVHFNPLGGRDARGCRIPCAGAPHDATGRPIAIPV